LAEFTGERIIPGRVDPDLLNEHFARYVFAARLARGKRVLDAGCGAGYGSAELAKSANFVTGFDVSGEAIQFAREQYRLPNLAFERASCAALPYADGAFDLVIAFEVIEHLENWREFLTEVRRVLVPAGQFIVSTPNRRYYAETREKIGPNPFHVHEFEYREFREELSQLFPYVSIFLENHAEGVVFQPVEPDEAAEVRIDAAAAVPDGSHFFVAVCAHRPQTGSPTFVYIPTSGNVLRERERHIDLLEAELRQKNDWLGKSQREHQELVQMFRAQQKELEQRAEWGMQLNRDLDAAGARIRELRDEVSAEQAAAREVSAAYEAKVAELEEENRRKTQWALDTEARLGAELQVKLEELAQCVEYLHRTEVALDERAKAAKRLQVRMDDLERRVALYQASRWVKLGKSFGFGPKLPAN
jgi:cyclopropane fatty-acyl-phospholipid synthase-like methyltransferase